MGVSRNQVAIFKQILPLFSSSYLFALRIKATFMARNLLNNEMRLWINKYTLPKHTHTLTHREREGENTQARAHTQIYYVKQITHTPHWTGACCVFCRWTWNM